MTNQNALPPLTDPGSFNNRSNQILSNPISNNLSPASTEKTDNELTDNIKEKGNELSDDTEVKETEDEESWFTKKPKLVPSKPQIGM